jgi:hypothetical protein
MTRGAAENARLRNRWGYRAQLIHVFGRYAAQDVAKCGKVPEARNGLLLNCTGRAGHSESRRGGAPRPVREAPPRSRSAEVSNRSRRRRWSRRCHWSLTRPNPWP